MSDTVLDFTRALAAEAGQLALTLRAERDAGFIDSKGLQDFVTAADLAVEKLIRARIAEAYPADAVLGEEGGAQGTGPVTWVVDPIDGTANFMRGLPEWGISIARVEGESLTHAVMDFPDLSLQASAAAGQGAFANGRPMEVSTTEDPERALVTLGWSRATEMDSHLSMIRALGAAGFEYRRHGAATFSLLAVASGWAEAYHERRIHAWDALAGALIVIEAGGAVQMPPMDAFLSGPGEFQASNGKICLPG